MHPWTILYGSRLLGSLSQAVTNAERFSDGYHSLDRPPPSIAGHLNGILSCCHAIFLSKGRNFAVTPHFLRKSLAEIGLREHGILPWIWAFISVLSSIYHIINFLVTVDGSHAPLGCLCTRAVQQASELTNSHLILASYLCHSGFPFRSLMIGSFAKTGTTVILLRLRNPTHSTKRSIKAHNDSAGLPSI
ncbi:unnamed protein product [Somion occarium]|uniref:Vomeronasal type-1 receptor n=1 Tax=Somion occarium TaxID=3059160 RepID=A0ABP1D6U9_9APHY